MTYLFDFAHGPKVLATFGIVGLWGGSNLHLDILGVLLHSVMFRLNDCLVYTCVSCSLAHHTDLGNPTLTWFWSTRGSLSSSEREQSCGRLTLWVCSVVHKPCCLFPGKSGFLVYVEFMDPFPLMCGSFRPQVGWKLGPTLDPCSMESFTLAVKKMFSSSSFIPLQHLG